MAPAKTRVVLNDSPPVKFGDALPSLADEIRRIRSEAEAYIDTKVDQLKVSHSGRDQPREALKNMLTHGIGCHCVVALNLLET